ncbi:MAG: WXG100 family type VII secretion target [Lactobacillus sp.]|jgi:WXG100 family type VII secretion target|nr:WXG100 family type VII secretion target [Lactobacillus sp.]MCI2033096.1 WXG100 family type VII secretion target [Lactobacillus sp.]
MAGVISVTPEQLTEQAKVYTQAAEGIRTLVAQVESTNNEIATEWKGQAFTAYLAQYETLKQQIVKFEDLLTEINGQLNKYANTVAARDQQDASSFGLN